MKQLTEKLNALARTTANVGNMSGKSDTQSISRMVVELISVVKEQQKLIDELVSQQKLSNARLKKLDSFAITTKNAVRAIDNGT